MIVGQPLEGLYESAYHYNILRLSHHITSNPNHALNSGYEF